MIRDSDTQEIVRSIPDGLISISFKGKNKSEAAMIAMASRITFFSDTQVRIISKEGLDCILDYTTMDL